MKNDDDFRYEPGFRIRKKNGEVIEFWRESVPPMLNEAVKYIEFMEKHCPEAHEAAVQMLKDEEEAADDILISEGYRLFVLGLCTDE